jgi:hypothetical protein
MRIPKKLKIRRATWNVTFDNSIEKTDKAVGLCIDSTKKIVISPDSDRNETEETFIHELLHACWPKDVCGDRLEEKLIRSLSPILYKALKDNDLLVSGSHEPEFDKAQTDKPSKGKRRP